MEHGGTTRSCCLLRLRRPNRCCVITLPVFATSNCDFRSRASTAFLRQQMFQDRASEPGGAIGTRCAVSDHLRKRCWETLKTAAAVLGYCNAANISQVWRDRYPTFAAGPLLTVLHQCSRYFRGANSAVPCSMVGAYSG